MEKTLFTEDQRSALREASIAGGYKTSGGGKPFGKIATYKIKGKAQIESGQRGYIVTVKTDKGVKDVVYIHGGADVYDQAKAVALAIDKGKWSGGRDDHPSRRIRGITVKGKTMTVEHDK